jgi:hypothetical protein
LALTAIVLAPLISALRREASQVDCVSNIRQITMAALMYC